MAATLNLRMHLRWLLISAHKVLFELESAQFRNHTLYSTQITNNTYNPSLA